MRTILKLLVLVVLLPLGCRRTDVREVVIRVPEMKNQQCADIITLALGATRYGVRMDSITTDLASRTIMLRYDSMQLSLKNIEFTIANAGFQANEVPANGDAAAKLPPECR